MTTIRPDARNRPGMHRVDYRAGTHSTFKAAMLARLSSADLPPLAQLTTRSDDDFTIALLDAWAAASDVLTFYTERIANESYLGTATERRSLTALGGLVGYVPHPGVAASVHLAFTLEDAGGAGEITAPPGLQVMSVPGPGEQPQTFETIEPLTGRPEWNALRAVSTKARSALSAGKTTIHLRGTSTNLRPGDMVVVELRGRPVQESEHPPQDLGEMRWTGPLPPAPDIAVEPWAVATRRTREAEAESVETVPRRVLAVRANPVSNTTEVELDHGAAGHEGEWRITAVYAMRQRAALFGHNAPQYDGLPANHLVRDDGTRKTLNPKPFKVNWDQQTLAREPANVEEPASIDLDRVYPQVTPGSFLVLSRPQSDRVFRVESHYELSRAGYTLSGRISRLKLDGASSFEDFTLRGTTVFAQSEELALADDPLTDPVSGASVLVEGAHADLTAGRDVVVSGVPVGSDAATSEIATLEEVSCDHATDTTELTFVTTLAYQYERGTVAINANVARATHGESRARDLGVGDGAAAFQSFVLPEAPLTYVAADNALGAASTLTVHVNGQRWAEVPWLHGRGPDERVYVTRIDDEGRATITFGDGKTGARVPTGAPGASNVQATYRTGTGPEGMVAAGQISLLKTSPLGIRSVVNPLPSTGAAARETSAGIRRNAPLPVRSLGRIVSLRDYEDFARAFGGVAKALATWSGRAVLLTVAGDDGAVIEPGSATYTNLLGALRGAGDPTVPLRVESYRPAYFRLAGTLTVDPTYDAEAVVAAVEGALRARFSFDNREFAQPVTLSQVYAAGHAVRGVRALHIQELRRVDAEASTGRVSEVLPSAAPTWAPGREAQGAELLLLDPHPDRLKIRKG